MAVTQYVGARYVPLFAEPLNWDSTKVYEPLTIVLYAGNSYTSRQSVPAGIDINNTSYWALTGNYNAQIEQYRKEVAQYGEAVTQNSKDIAAEILRATGVENTLSTKIDNVESELAQNISDTADKITEGYKAADTALKTELESEISDIHEIDTDQNTRIDNNKDDIDTINKQLISDKGGSLKWQLYGSYYDTVNNYSIQSFTYREGNFIIVGQSSSNANQIFYTANVAGNAVTTKTDVGARTSHMNCIKWDSINNRYCVQGTTQRIDFYNESLTYISNQAITNNMSGFDTNDNCKTWYGFIELGNGKTKITHYSNDFKTILDSFIVDGATNLSQSARFINGILYCVGSLGVMGVNVETKKVTGLWSINNCQLELEDIIQVDNKLYGLFNSMYGFTIRALEGGLGSTQFTYSDNLLYGSSCWIGTNGWLEDNNENRPIHNYSNLNDYLHYKPHDNINLASDYTMHYKFFNVISNINGSSNLTKPKLTIPGFTSCHIAFNNIKVYQTKWSYDNTMIFRGSVEYHATTEGNSIWNSIILSGQNSQIFYDEIILGENIIKASSNMHYSTAITKNTVYSSGTTITIPSWLKDNTEVFRSNTLSVEIMSDDTTNIGVVHCKCLPAHNSTSAGIGLSYTGHKICTAKIVRKTDTTLTIEAYYDGNPVSFRDIWISE